jgi:hypothetical protein
MRTDAGCGRQMGLTTYSDARPPHTPYPPYIYCIHVAVSSCYLAPACCIPTAATDRIKGGDHTATVAMRYSCDARVTQLVPRPTTDTAATVRRGVRKPPWGPAAQRHTQRAEARYDGHGRST